MTAPQREFTLVREIVEPERLVFTWGGEDNRPAVITVTFDEHNGGTRLTYPAPGRTCRVHHR
jgi:uncharacterized protein YndB with AHSA1/START domain